ncbi:lectin [Streptomyces odontomachi]|uniref:lectin n=1 Tax=Streptomyces odontomachi TaxID=2944940 RepID=UPI002108B32D|nr:lectin [Streptomyces sp. ODS25]
MTREHETPAPRPRPRLRTWPRVALSAGTALLLTAAVATTAAAAPFDGVPAQVHRAAPAAIDDPAQYVNPFVGTQPGDVDYGNGGGAGNTFPGASAPFGMVQWSPDTVQYQHGGYYYDDNRIRGFSLTHISGAGCGDYGNIPFMPVLGSSPVDYSTFDHADESSSPGSYAVTFDNGLRTELTAAQHSGTARFTYPAGQQASLTIDAAKAFNAASGSLSIGTNTVSGYSDSGGFCGAGNRYRVYFHATFDHDFTTSGVLSDGKLDTSRRSVSGHTAGVAQQAPKTVASQNAAGTKKVRQSHPSASSTKSAKSAKSTESTGSAAAGALGLVSFDTSADPSVTVRVGVSFVSLAGAQANEVAEQGGTGFDAMRDKSRAAWNDMLGRISVTGGTTTQKQVLYTGLYHSLLHPSVFSDVNGQYMGFDKAVHTVAAGHAQYADFSGWDVYRSQVQLVALLAPKEASDIAQSAVNQAAQAGYADRWTLANGGTGVMNGDPLPSIEASIYAFGGTDFDASAAVRQAVAGASDDRERPGHGDYDSLGFIRSGASGVWGSAATTLEYAGADFAVSQLAGRVGDTSTHDTFLHRAENWRNLFESGQKYLKPRNADHTWPAFSPTQENEYVEGDAAQYTWAVPWNYRGLFDAMGGDTAVRSRLDDFFTKLNAGPGSPYAYLGNEPTLETPWAYDYAGAPAKAQDVVRRALTTVFKATPDGEVGNDDLGEMASWSVWASLGMYPEAPGRAELALASPLFPTTVITRGNGKVITINAPQASESSKYVTSLAVNGAASSKPWLPESFVTGGGTLDYTLSSTATTWGSDPADAPPSFDVGPKDPVTGPITGIAGKCVDVNQSSTADGTAVQLWTCNGSDAQKWTLASDGTLRAFGKCLDVVTSGTANGTLVQLWSCNGTGAQQWWAKGGGALVNPASGRCLDVPQSATDDGTRLQIWDCNGTSAQTWTLAG